MASPPQQRRVHEALTGVQVKPAAVGAGAIGDERVRSADEGVATMPGPPPKAVAAVPLCA